MIVANLFGVLEGPEALIILAVVVLLFGGKKVPELARSLGLAKREFHEASDPTARAAEAPPPPAIDPAPESTPADDTVTISRAELDRLRAAAHDHGQNLN
ncbi:MAG TPA: twin-arginine translocase TatA/TatE family subunit [Acidimicrobiales bacterium]|jgi:sec-independent protein translocase protein TatA|nr:twin-arginine translocase TatA/TatE family subunit [Acidimicrobiales bacterium]